MSDKGKRSDVKSEAPSKDDSSANKGPALCKGVLGQRIALDYSEPIKHKSPIMRPGHQSFIIVGKSGCGKTVLALSLIPYFSRLSSIVYCSRIQNTDIFAAIARWAKETERDKIPSAELKKLRQRAWEDATEDERKQMKEPGTSEEAPQTPKRIRFFVCSTPAEFNDTISPLATAQRFGEDIGYHTVCIFDDFRSKAGTESDPYVNCAIMANCTLRNYGMFSIWMSQSYSKLTPSTLRCNCNNLIAFSMSNKFARDALYNDFSPLWSRFGQEGVRALYEDIAMRPHGFLWMILRDNTADLYRYEDESSGLQKVESADERSARRYASTDTLGSGAKQELCRIGRGAREAKLHEMQRAHDSLLRDHNDTESRRLAAVLWTRIWALAEKIGASEGRDPSDVLDSRP